MIVEDNVARYEQSARPGCGTFKIQNCIADKEFGDYRNALAVLIVRSKSEEHLADWVSPNPDDFLVIRPKNPQQRAREFKFEVGPEVVNPMAYDNSGDYTLKIKDVNGIPRAYKVSLENIPRASKGNGPQPQKRPGFKAQAPNASNLSEEQKLQAAQAGLNKGPAAGAAGFAGTAGAAGAAGAANVPPKMTPRDAAAQRAAASAQREENLRKGSGLVKVLGILGVIVVLAILGFFMKDLLKGLFSGGPEVVVGQTASQPEESAAPEEPAEPEVVLTPAQQNCRIDGNSADDRTIINNCLSAQPTAQDMQNLLVEAMRAERCEIALRILRTKGRAADGGVFAYVYATYADPSSSYSSSCITKSAQDAAYWTGNVAKDLNFTEAAGQELLDLIQAAPDGASNASSHVQSGTVVGAKVGNSSAAGAADAAGAASGAGNAGAASDHERGGMSMGSQRAL